MPTKPDADVEGEVTDDRRTPADAPPEAAESGPPRRRWWQLLLRDRLATVAAFVLLLILLTAAVGPRLIGDLATRQDLENGNLPPFSLDAGWAFVLGSDNLGRSILARLVEGAGTSLSVALPAVFVSLIVGGAFGMWAGFHRGWRENVAMRIADVIMSFPSLLLAVVVLYIFDPSVANLIVVLALTRIPIYLRTARAEASELQSRLFVDAARTFGTPSGATIRRHVLPVIMPTLLTVATLDFAFVMLAESSLSFLGIGIQPPDMSWGLMVAQGRQYLQTAWWISFFPGIAIILTTASATILSSWLRLATDPGQRWRLALPRQRRRTRRPAQGVK